MQDHLVDGRTDTSEAASPADRESATLFGLSPGRLLVLMVALLFLAAVVGYRVGLPDRPSGESADVGFLQDMIIHHQQAVTMSFFTANAATDDVVRAFAKEIMSLQQYEIGLMEAWLGRWGHARESRGSTSMAWAGMAHPKGAMPGMATTAELDALYAATGPEVDDRFLLLMILHHAGGVGMAEAVLERGEDREVRVLARRIVKAQRTEISEMQFARRRLGFPPVEVPADGGHTTGTTSATGTTGTTGTTGDAPHHGD